MNAPPKQGCNLNGYLTEQELLCRRMERTANVDTPHGQEWRRVADTLCVLRVEHAMRCERCKPAAVNGTVKA